MTKYQRHPDYDQLPESIKEIYSPEEHAWLSDEEKERILDTHCYPEPEEDDG